MKLKYITLLIVSFLLTSCSPVSTKWHEEPVTKESVTVDVYVRNGNGQKLLEESLVVKSHGWKVLAIDKENEQCEWGFRVDLECKTSSKLVREIEYTLYDKDDFSLTTITLRPGDLEIISGGSKTFRNSTRCKTDLLKRAILGRVHVEGL